MAAVADLKRDRAKLVSRASTRDLQLPRCFIRQPVLSSRFSSPDVARFERTNERRLSSHSSCNVDRVAVRESDKSGTGRYIHRGLHGDFEESVWIQGDRARLRSRDRWCIMDGQHFQEFSWGIKLYEGLMFFANLDCQQWWQNNLEWRIWFLFSLLLLSLLLSKESKNWNFSSLLIQNGWESFYFDLVIFSVDRNSIL